MDENVSKADAAIMASCRGMEPDATTYRHYPIIRARLVELEVENARLQSRLTAADALLRECVHFIDHGGAADDDLAEKIDAHLSGNGHD